MKNKKLLTIALVGFCLFFAGGTAAHLSVAENRVFSAFELEEKYYVGEELDVSAAKIINDGKEYACDKFLVYPSGNTLLAETFFLSEAGEYTLKLQAEINGRRTVVKKTVSVYSPYCSFVGSASSAQLTEEGYKISLADGDNVVFNQVVDLRTVTLSDEIFKATILPSTPGEADFSVLDITFTDVEDEDSTLCIRLRGYDWGTYALAGATYQPLSGYEPEWDRLHKDNQWGAFSNRINFYGISGTSSTFDIRFDSESKEVYFLPNAFIVDLDDPRQFSNVWEGFTSGKVRINVSASEYNKSRATLLVRSLGGTKPDSDLCEDKEAPEISVDADENDLPAALVGSAYPVFPATATDDWDGAVAVSAQVFKNYYELNRCNITVSDNAFTPSGAGEYFIVYTAVDKAGNQADKVVVVRAENDLPQPRLTLEEMPASGEIGSYVTLPAYTVDGGTGTVDVRIRVSYANGEITVRENAFLPEYEGEYTIEYVATDYIGRTHREVCSFICERLDKAVLAQTPVLPKYMLRGKTYELPSATVIDYSSGRPEQGECEIFLKTELGEKRISGNTFTADIDGEEAVFLYKYKTVLSYRVSARVIDVGTQGDLDMSRYFATDGGMQSEATYSGILLTTSEQASSAGAEFIRELLTEGLSLRFSVHPDRAAYEGLDVVLTDVLDSGRTVRISYRKNDNGVSFYLNGVYQSRLLSFGFTSESADNTFLLSMEDGYVVPYSEVNVKVNSYENGRPFEGFSSGRAYVRWELINVTGESALTVRNINGQTFNASGNDRMRPQIVLYGDYGGEVAYGTDVTTALADAADVLDPEIIFTVSVLCPDKKTYARSTDGRELKDLSPYEAYTFTIGEYGQFIVRYTATDGNSGQSAVRSYVVLCEDKTAPEIYFEEGAETCFIGDTVAIPALYTDGDVAVRYLFLTSPSGENVLLEESNDGFTATVAGVWTVVCVAYDEAGNQSMATYRIKAVVK